MVRQLSLMIQGVYEESNLIVLFKKFVGFFGNSILAGKLFAKALRNLSICLSANNNLCGKLFSLLESPIIFDNNLKFTSVEFFVAGFNWLSCKFDNFTLIT